MIKTQANGMNTELNAHNTLLAEIENEVGENIGTIENGLKKLGIVMEYASDRCLMILICVLFFIFLMLIFS